MCVIIPCAIFIDSNIDLISFGRGKPSVFFNSPSALVRLYQHVQHRRQCLSKFISLYSKAVSLCQTFSVTSAQYQYFCKFVSEKGESEYFSDLVVIIYDTSRDTDFQWTVVSLVCIRFELVMKSLKCSQYVLQVSMLDFRIKREKYDYISRHLINARLHTISPIEWKTKIVTYFLSTIKKFLWSGCPSPGSVSYTHLRAHETSLHLVSRLLLEKIFF